MALPARLGHLDSMVDLLADLIARDIERDSETTTPAEQLLPAGANSTQDERHEGYQRAATAATSNCLAELPPAILERLAAEGVHSLSDWRALGRRRHQLFGIVPSVIRWLDELSRC